MRILVSRALIARVGWERLPRGVRRLEAMDLLALVAAADRIGIVAFALSGVAVGMRARMDLFGLAALGLVTAIGGGVMRDVVIGDVPRAFVTTDYLLFAVGATVVGILAGSRGWESPEAIHRAADAVGTGAFGATGALLAAQAGLGWPAAVLLGILTATGGGVIRDLLSDQVPRVLHSEMNATAAACGGALTFILRGDPTLAAVLGGAVGAIISGLGHSGLLRLPKPGVQRDADTPE